MGSKVPQPPPSDEGIAFGLNGPPPSEIEAAFRDQNETTRGSNGPSTNQAKPVPPPPPPPPKKK